MKVYIEGQLNSMDVDMDTSPWLQKHLENSEGNGQIKREVSIEDIAKPLPAAEDFSNALLRQNRASKDPEYPAYDERYLAKRNRKRGKISLEEHAAKSGVEISTIADLLSDELAKGIESVSALCIAEIQVLIKDANLTDRQQTCLALALVGTGYSSIAKTLRIDESTVRHHIERAIDKISQTEAAAVAWIIWEEFGWDGVRIILRKDNNHSARSDCAPAVR